MSCLSQVRRQIMKPLENLWSNHYEGIVIGCYWVLGLCNNFPYVVMLSAAHDILSPAGNGTSNSSEPVPLPDNSTNKYDCNEISTGAVLLCDIIPGIIIKLLAPFFMHKIPYSFRVTICAILSSFSFILVALAPVDLTALAFAGVMCASLSTSFGEITFLSLTTYYSHKLSISGWSSGTGAAGLFGAFGYAAITSAGVSPRETILYMTFIPILLVLSYLLLPTIEFAQSVSSLHTHIISNAANTSGSTASVDKVTQPDMVVASATSEQELPTAIERSVLQRLGSFMRPLLKYMIPLFLVYFAEYFINQGLFELLYFPDDPIFSEHTLQYRWYNVVYQAAVFVSRSSIRFFEVRFLAIFPVLQLANVGVALGQIFFGYFTSIWFVIALIFWEGLLGGGCYVNAFNQLSTSTEIAQERKAASIAVTSIADSLGITLAGFISIPVHNAICALGRK